MAPSSAPDEIKPLRDHPVTSCELADCIGKSARSAQGSKARQSGIAGCDGDGA
jgi:hypothetical protein